MAGLAPAMFFFAGPPCDDAGQGPKLHPLTPPAIFPKRWVVATIRVRVLALSFLLQ